MFESLKRAFTTRDAAFRECRRCGATVDDTPDCPTCGSNDIASYRV
jgi:anaerobic ribonucleoside-triphosphate reductase